MAIHPTAVIHPRAELAADVEVGPFCVIDEHVRVARGCRLIQRVYLTGWTEIGECCVIHPGAIVGHEPQDVKYHGERSYVRVGARTVLREYVTVHRGTMPDSTTKIGDDCFLLAGVHVAHNCSLGNRVTLINNVLLAGHVEVADQVTMGGGAVVHQFVRIGTLAMVAGNARVPMDLIPFALTDVEGRIAGLNRIGMRRANLSRDDFEEARAIYRQLYSGHTRFSEAVSNVVGCSWRTPSGQALQEFLVVESRRGIAGGSRHRGLVADGT